jgi:hypothetical protein
VCFVVQTAPWRWLNNDVISFASSIVGSLVAGLFGVAGLLIAADGRDEQRALH